MKKVVTLLVLTLLSLTSYSQCAMCKAAVESNGNAGDSMAAGLNAGIMYLMFIPYLLIAVIAFFMYRHKKKLNQNSGA